MTALSTEHAGVIVSGTVENQVDFNGRFEHVVLLSAPLETLLERVTSGSNNPYDQTPEEQDEIRVHLQSVAPLLRRGATLELDGRRPTNELAYTVESLLA